MPFDSIRGHAIPVRILGNMVTTRQIPHAFIFAGIEGIGKRTTAFSFAKALNCCEMPGDFCDRCPSCRKIEKMVHPDLVCVAPEKNVIRIEQVRALQQEIAFAPLEGKKRVVIIDQADRLNRQAANCLLKTLEEPPEDTVLILLAQSTAALLPTVVSRCQKISFAPLGSQDIVHILVHNDIAKDEAERIAANARGSIQKARFLHESGFISMRQETAAALSRISSGDCEALFTLTGLGRSDTPERAFLLEFLITWYRDMLLVKEGIAEEMLCNRDLLHDLREGANHATSEKILQSIKELQWIQSRNMSVNLNVEMGLQSLLAAHADTENL